jgi:hypothetical protein
LTGVDPGSEVVSRVDARYRCTNARKLAVADIEPEQPRVAAGEMLAA